MSVSKWSPCMVRPILIDINPAERKYYSYIISLNKSTGSSNVLSLKICVPKKKQKTYMANSKQKTKTHSIQKLS